MRSLPILVLGSTLLALACHPSSRNKAEKEPRPSGGGSGGSSRGGGPPPASSNEAPDDVIDACADVVLAYGAACGEEYDLDVVRSACRDELDGHYADACHDEFVASFECQGLGPFACDDPEALLTDDHCDEVFRVAEACLSANEGTGGSSGGAGGSSGGSSGSSGGSSGSSGGSSGSSGGSGGGSGGSAGSSGGGSAGSSSSGLCTGTARSCGTYPATPEACGSQSGCTLDVGSDTGTFDDVCTGESTPCESFFDEDSCRQQDGCIW